MNAPQTVAGHTAGPFAVHPGKAWIVCSQLDDAGEPCPVAALAWPTKYRSEAETLANGHLFAAATDMLAALLPFAAITFAGTVWADKDDDAAVLYDHATGNQVTLGDFKRAAAAIAKATAARQSGDGA